MTSPAAWMLLRPALDMDSWAHPLHSLALRIDLRHGDMQGWPEHKLSKPKWEN